MLLFCLTSAVTDQCSSSANSTNLAKPLTCVRWKELRRKLCCQTCFETNTWGETVKGRRNQIYKWNPDPYSMPGHSLNGSPSVPSQLIFNAYSYRSNTLEWNFTPRPTKHARLFFSSHRESGSIARVPHQWHNTMPLLGDKQFSPYSSFMGQLCYH